MTALITAGLLLKEVRPKCKMVEVREVASLCSETFLAITTGLVLCDTDGLITIHQSSSFKTVILNVLQSWIWNIRTREMTEPFLSEYQEDSDVSLLFRQREHIQH